MLEFSQVFPRRDFLGVVSELSPLKEIYFVSFLVGSTVVM
jgi:hypothetical protein